MQGLEWFNHALKYDKDERTQKTIEMKMTQYMDRIELLRANVASGGSSSGTAQARKPKPTDDGMAAEQRAATALLQEELAMASNLITSLRSQLPPSSAGGAVCSKL